LLLQDKKGKIEQLLDKWKLLHGGKGVSPYHSFGGGGGKELGHFLDKKGESN
jgi:hypothetical protein